MANETKRSGYKGQVMLIQKAFKYRLRTTPEIEEKLRRMAGCRRFVWNNGLAAIKAALDAGEKRPSYGTMSSQLTIFKKDHQFLAEEAVAQSLQQTLMDLDRAVKDAFDKKQPLKEFPVFKKKGKSNESFRIPQGFEVDQDNSRIKLPKLGWIRYRNCRQVTGTPRNVTISLQAGNWYASVQTEQEVSNPVHRSTKQIGGDCGINSFLALSDGTLIQPLNAFKTASRKLGRMQRQLSRKIKFSENWKKCKTRITKLHSRIAAMRKDYLHKLSTIIAKNHGVVVLEDLKIKNMSASAKGTTEVPGRKVKQKSGLNRSILDQGWGEFARQLEYKLKWLGGTFLKVPPQYTSQKCSCCGHTEAGNRKAQNFLCLSCGFESHADINAAKNILAAGLAVIACGEHLDVTGSMKQEPTGGEHVFA
jgi:putative transposase